MELEQSNAGDITLEKLQRLYAETIKPHEQRVSGVIMAQTDVVVGALTAWRENRGGGEDGMQSVLNVLVNRAKQRGTSIYAEAVLRLQFSSMTAPGDPNLVLFPTVLDPEWLTALSLASKAASGLLDDITGGATFYYAASMPRPPIWASSMIPTVTIAGQHFFCPKA